MTEIILNVFEAGKGDFFWLEYITEEGRRHILIDSGSGRSFRDYGRVLKYIKDREEIIEAMIFTHIDGDHIGGGIKALSLINEERFPAIKRIMMNSVTDISMCINNDMQLSVGQAIKLENVFETLGLSEKIIYPILQGDSFELTGDAWIKIISPNKKTFLQFEAMVDKKIEGRNNSPQLSRADEDLYKYNIHDYVSKNDIEDDRLENTVGIAFVFEMCNVRMAFLADANPRICAEGIELLYGTYVPFDLVKLAHHGSSKNTTRRLTEIINAQNFLLSTNGHNGKPSKQMLCRLLESREHINLLCNYKWWDQHYCGLYFSDKDREEYIENGRLNLVYLGEQEIRAGKNLTVRIRHKHKEI